MGYCFDTVIDRRGSGAIMTDCLQKYYGREDLLPLWIADMYFETPAPVRAALEKRLDHQIYGYAVAPESYWQSILSWEKETHGWTISRDTLCFIPGIVRGIAFVLQCFTRPGDKVVVQPPVYMPFLNVPRANGRQVVYNPLRFDEASRTYRMDLDNLETVCREERPKVLILSNPHNPAGIVWPAEDLARLAEICRRAGVLVVSDEIHADMALGDNVHHPFPTVSQTAADISITFAAPSKTFNIAGIVSSFCVVSNPALREPFFGYRLCLGLSGPPDSRHHGRPSAGFVPGVARLPRPRPGPRRPDRPVREPGPPGAQRRRGVRPRRRRAHAHECRCAARDAHGGAFPSGDGCQILERLRL